jgi:hypothetical protein
MIIVLWLLAIQGAMGAFDTLYYHEWRAKLPARIPAARTELRLHAARDFIYAIVFATLPWVAWHGLWAGILAALLIAEIFITLSDFIVEDRARRSLGGIYPGERVTHALMGIVYGAVLAHLIPVLAQWWQMPTALALRPQAIPNALRFTLALMAIGVGLSGVRDLYASTGLPRSGWPWRVAKEREYGVQS